jgi:hypothetical protein
MAAPERASALLSIGLLREPRRVHSRNTWTTAVRRSVLWRIVVAALVGVPWISRSGAIRLVRLIFA